MKQRFLLLSFLAVLSTFTARAEPVESRVAAPGEVEKTPLDLFELEGSFVFESELSDDDTNVDLGKQDASSFRLEYAHRFHLNGHFYLRAGLAYDRFDFSQTTPLVPDQLHSLAGVVSLDYMVGADRGAFLEFRPGFYAQEEFREEAFDVPITLARAWILQPEKLFLITGANVAFLRGQYPVLPFIGVIWRPNDQWNIYGVLPEPRVTYRANKNLDIWVGGDLTGGSFRTDLKDNFTPRKLRNAQVDYSEYRGGLGAVFHFNNAVYLDLGGGYVFQRTFNYERADREFNVEPAPYVRVALKAEF